MTPYKEETFDQMMSQAKDYNKVVHSKDYRWHFVRNLYNVNYLDSSGGPSLIPKKIHQIWVGGELPSEYKAYTESWSKFHPTWEYKLWTDNNIHELEGVNWTLYNTIRNPAQRSDLLRYHILNQFGGLYVDTDFECLKPFDDLDYLDFYTAIGFNRYVELYIGLIASIPYHPITEALTQGIKKVIGGHWRNMFSETGSYYFTRKFIEVGEFWPNKVVAFPMWYFYPYPNYERHKGVDPYQFVKPYSYAIHHWAVSWGGKK